jgi:carboxyl-terminal processing protease
MTSFSGNAVFRPVARLAAVVTIALGVGFAAGAAVGRATAAPLIVVPEELQRANLVQPFNDLFQAYHLLTTQSYYAPQLNRKTLLYAAINGMMSGGTGDPHTIFLSPQDTTAAQAEMNGSFDGIGASVDVTAHGLVVVPLAGSPAARAGLRSGDVIVRIDGHDVTVMNGDEAVTMLRGPAGTRVTLSVQRSGVHGLLTVVVTRGHITVPNVVSRMIGAIAYLKIAQFGDTTASDVVAALRGLMAHHPRGLVLDLRDDPGGFVDTAVTIDSQFLPQGRVILWEQNGQRHLEAPVRSAGTGLVLSTPLAILVNDGTASAAEITAGALQDYRRATIVGIQTYGKGSVQQEFPLDDGSSLRITTHLWLTPHQRLIQNRGITPDVTVDSPVSDGSPGDLQLSRALTLLGAGRSS